MSRLIFILLGLILLPMSWAQSESPEIVSVRFAGAGEVTRVIIESDQPLSADTSVAITDQRPTLVIDLPLVTWRIGGEYRSGGAGTGHGHVAGFRYGQLGPGQSRLTLDLAGPVKIYRELELPPASDAPFWRYTYDLMPEDPDTFAKVVRRDEKRLSRREGSVQVAERAEPAPRREGVQVASASTTPSVKPVIPGSGTTRAPRTYLIVIDPGHGGKDPGAIAKSGLTEKEVNLSTALILKEILDAHPRFRVRLTRDTDTFVELERRVELAREWGADLFISVHADSAKSTDAQGASVYTISERGAARSRRQDWDIDFGIGETASQDVQDILGVLVERETQTQSSVFAEALISTLGQRVPLLRNTHRSAGFVVLLAPDVPAVLLELGFLTHPEDVKRLASEKGRRESAEAIAQGIELYFAQRELKLAE